VLVLAGAVVERSQAAEHEVGESVAATGGARRAGKTAVELEVTGATVVVVDLRPHVLDFRPELDAVSRLDPVGPVDELEPVAREPRLEIVADVEVADSLDLGDRFEPRQIRQS